MSLRNRKYLCNSFWLDCLGNGKWRGGANVLCDFGGRKRTIACALQNQFWGRPKVGLVWSVPVSSKENDRAWTIGGETCHRWGGLSRTVLGEGFLVRFTSPEFSTPLCRTLRGLPPMYPPPMYPTPAWQSSPILHTSFHEMSDIPAMKVLVCTVCRLWVLLAVLPLRRQRPCTRAHHPINSVSI